MPPKKTEILDFEAALTELNTLIEQMEQGGIGLEESLKQFERGVFLTRHCQEALQAAEQKVSILIEKNAKAELAPYHPNEQE